MFDFIGSAECIHGDNRPALRMRALPRRLGERIEGSSDAIVETAICFFKPIRRAALVGARESFADWHAQEHCEIWCESCGREFIACAHFARRQSASVNLIRVGAQQKPIEQDVLSRSERRLDHRRNQLRARGHKQRGLCGRSERHIRMQQQFANAIAHWCATWFAMHSVRHARVRQTHSESLELGGLPRSLTTLEDDEAAAHRSRNQPSVIIELVAPFLMPSSIH